MFNIGNSIDIVVILLHKTLNLKLRNAKVWQQGTDPPNVHIGPWDELAISSWDRLYLAQ